MGQEGSAADVRFLQYFLVWWLFLGLEKNLEAKRRNTSQEILSWGPAHLRTRGQIFCMKLPLIFYMNHEECTAWIDHLPLLKNCCNANVGLINPPFKVNKVNKVV